MIYAKDSNECNIIHTGEPIPHFSFTLTVMFLDLKPENVLIGFEKMLSLNNTVADEIIRCHHANFFLSVLSTCIEMILAIQS